MLNMLEEYDALIDSMNDVKKCLADKNQFTYIYTKAYIFLKQGHEIYFKNDFYGNSFQKWNKSEISIIHHGCKQILDGKGLTKDEPFTKLGVFGFSNLFYMLHFVRTDRKTLRIKENSKIIFIDRIDFRHVVNESVIQYFNLVEHKHN